MQVPLVAPVMSSCIIFIALIHKKHTLYVNQVYNKHIAAMEFNVPEMNSMSTHTVIVPSATHGSLLNAANQSMFKGHLNVPHCKGPCMVAVLLNGMHIGCPNEINVFSGLACPNLSYAVKSFEEHSFLLEKKKLYKLLP